VALGSHSSKGRPRDDTLASELARLEGEAKRCRARAGDHYSHLLLAEASGVPEAKFAPWLTGDAVPGDDDGDLMAVISTLALWAGQPMKPEQRDWLPLAAATRKRRPARAGRKFGGFLTRTTAWIGTIVAGVIAGIVLIVVGPWFTPRSGIAPTSATGVSSVPFGHTVSRTNGRLGQCAGWLFPQPIQKIPYTRLQGSQNVAADEKWALRNGGADVNGGAYTITLQGNSTTENVAIRDVRIKILSRKPTHAGTVIYNGLGCGGGLAEQVFTVQVDSPNPRFVAQNGATKWPYTISGTDIEYLIMDAGISPSNQDEYQFVYKIDWSQGSRQGTVTVSAPNGRPFTAAPLRPGSSTYHSDDGHWSS
jgi:hypothetical protein